MDKLVSLEGRGVIPCPHNAAEAHPYKGPPLSSEQLMTLLQRATARHAQLGIAIDNLRRILLEERLLCEDGPELPHGLLAEVHHALELAQAVIPGAHRDALTSVTRALERLGAYEDRLPQRGQA